MKRLLSLISIIVSMLFIPCFGDTSNFSTGNVNQRTINNSHLENIQEKYFNVTTLGTTGLKNTLIGIARDIKNGVFIILSVVVLILVFQVIFSGKTEEEVKKLKTAILWASVGIMVTQVAFSTAEIVYNKDINSSLAQSIDTKLLQPFLRLLYFLSAFAFITIAILSFYRVVTAHGNEDAAKRGKMSILYSLLALIVVKFAHSVVTNTLSISGGGTMGTAGLNENISENIETIVTIITWVNTFVAIFIIGTLMFIGFLFVLAGWNDENIKRAKRIVLYDFIGILVLVASYLLMNFFIGGNIGGTTS